jgi:hypothetical protein
MFVTWFGDIPLSPLFTDENHVAAPVGQPCLECGQPIKEGDRGFIQNYSGVKYDPRPMHFDCFLASGTKYDPPKI